MNFQGTASTSQIPDVSEESDCTGTDRNVSEDRDTPSLPQEPSPDSVSLASLQGKPILGHMFDISNI